VVAGRDQFGQVHVARRVEEVHAAETVAKLFRKNLSQLVDSQAGCIAGQHCVCRHERGDLLVQVLLPVHPLGDGLDDQVAILELFQPGLVVGRGDGLGQGLAGQRRRAELGQVGQRLQHDAVRVAVLGGQVEQHRIDAGIGQVRGDLRAHDTGTEHGRTTYE